MTNRRPADEQVLIVGAGIAGLVAAVECAARGLNVVVLEKSASAGGKIRQVTVPGGENQDAGPTVFTMREVFEETFSRAGMDFSAFVTIEPLTRIARHWWGANEVLDLFTNRDQSVQAISEFAGANEARGYTRFCDDAARLYDLLEHSFMRANRTSPVGLTARILRASPKDLLVMKPFARMWPTLGNYFKDPRLQQLFGRYATYCGSSPFQASAVLMLIAHAESRGVWRIRGGMYALVQALVTVGKRLGVQYRFNAPVQQLLTASKQVSGVELSGGEQVHARHVILNADINAWTNGAFGDARTARSQRRWATHSRHRSLSAVTWNIAAQTNGFSLAHHNVFFSGDYAREFKTLFQNQQVPTEPTVYVCAQDRDDNSVIEQKKERLFLLVNAPANGDQKTYATTDIERIQTNLLKHLARSGLLLTIDSDASITTTPSDFSRQFPETGGALYGRASHGWRASFQRPGWRTGIKGLYLASGSAHPGAGVPMAAISGQLAARALCDRAGANQ